MVKLFSKGLIVFVLVVFLSGCQLSGQTIEDVKEVDIGDTPATSVEKANSNEKKEDTNESKEEKKVVKLDKLSDEIKGKIIDGAKSDPTVTLIMSEVNPKDTIVGQMDMKFAYEVERCSGGSVTVDLKAGGTLGAEDVVLNKIFGGSNEIDIARISAFSLSEYGCSKSKLLSLPYLFESKEHYWNFVEGNVSKEILEEPQRKGLGVRGLFYGEEGFRHFFAKENLNNVKKFNGKKIRVADDPVMKGLVNGLGATPKDVAFTELYNALEKGEIDGAEQPIVNYQSNSFEKVCPNIVLDGHTLGAVEVIMSEIAWKKLTDNQKKVITEASKCACQFSKKLSDKKENETISQLKDKKVNVVKVSDKSPWQKATKSLVKKNIKGFEKLYKKIVKCK